jgi:basic membrane protein A
MHKGENVGTLRRLGMLLGASALVLGTLTVTVAATSTSAIAASKFKACVVTDTGGINDKSFNASAYKGLEDAAASDKNIVASYLSSTSSSDYAPNITTFEKEGCGIIVTVGFLMDAATAAAANADPTQKFAIVDDLPVAKKSHEVLALQYDTNQGAFLGGYYAAASSTTKVVATYGGADIPPVTVYMDGFVAGVRYYDKVNKADVKVLGYTPPKVCTLTNCAGKGTFVGNFTDETAGKTIAAGDYAAGADIVFPVAGSVGLGSITAAQQAGSGHYVIWVDTDSCATKALDAAQCKVVDGTVYKGVTPSVEAAALEAAHGTFKGGSYIGTLKNDGTGFAFDFPTSAALKAKIASIASGIEAGTISVNPNSYPAG